MNSFRGFTHSLQENAGILFLVKRRLFIFTFFSICQKTMTAIDGQIWFLTATTLLWNDQNLNIDWITWPRFYGCWEHGRCTKHGRINGNEREEFGSKTEHEERDVIKVQREYKTVESKQTGPIISHYKIPYTSCRSFNQYYTWMKTLLTANKTNTQQLL